MPNHYCCVLTCKMTKRNAGTDVRFIKFPVDLKLLERWRSVIGRGPDFPISQSTRICSRHFVSGRRSLNPVSEDYIPSIFPPSEYRKRTLCRGCRKMNCICDGNGADFNPALITGELGNPLDNSLYGETNPDDNAPDDDDDDDAKDSDASGLNEVDGTPIKRRKVAPSPVKKTPQPTSSTSRGSIAPKSDNLTVATKLVKRELEVDLLARIKEAELEHSRKMEMMSKHHNMTVANLKEEFQQKFHALKSEWQDEKQKMWTEIQCLKHEIISTRRPYF